MTKFLLDSGDPQEYKNIAALAKQHNSELWGATTNPSLIAKQLSGKKLTKQEAFQLQKNIVLEIISILPGVVSAEVYADKTTPAEEMIQQGKEIATWHERIAVKLPTTIEGFKARTDLRKAGILTNNTLVFSQQQIFAICLHEQIIENTFGPLNNKWPTFISPFIGRLDDIGQQGSDLVKYGMEIKKLFQTPTWMLAASIRHIEHVEQSIAVHSELITAPAGIYEKYFSQTEPQGGEVGAVSVLKPIPYWQPADELLQIKTIEEFIQALETNKIDVHHELTDKGIDRFVADWQAILQ